jgi:hypothetical protein
MPRCFFLSGVAFAALFCACGSANNHDQLFSGTAGNASSVSTGSGSAGAASSGTGLGSAGTTNTGGAAGASNMTGGGGSSMGPGGPGSGSIDMIDDMEDNDASILMTGDRNGAWFSIHDETPGSLWPPADSPFVMSPLPQPRGTSKVSVRSNGSGFGNWGAAVGIVLKIDDAKQPLFYDASAYKGITFWARIGENSTTSLRVDLPDKNTFPKGGVCQGTQCNDHFGESISSLSQAWKQFTIAFSELKQSNFGLQQPALDTAHLAGIQFEFGKDATFFVLIDDLAFYK